MHFAIILQVLIAAAATLRPKSPTGLFERMHPKMPSFFKSGKSRGIISSASHSSDIVRPLVTRQDHLDKADQLLSKASTIETELLTSFQPKLNKLAAERTKLINQRALAKQKKQDESIQILIAGNLHAREKMLLDMSTVKAEARELKDQAATILRAAEELS